MIVLVLTVCALTAPSDCREARTLYDVTPMQCALHGQEMAAQYVEAHPGASVTRWRCTTPERDGSGV